MEQVAEAYPLLDIVDHDNRKRIAREGYTEKELPRIEGSHFVADPLALLQYSIFRFPLYFSKFFQRDCHNI